MDDIDGWPQVTGVRQGDADAGQWTLTLTPEGLRVDGPERSAVVDVDAVYAVRQRPAAAQSFGPVRVLEVEWVTSLQEERTLSLLTDDAAGAERLAQVLTSQLRELDGNQPRERRPDWVVLILMALGAVLGVRSVGEMMPLQSAFDWTAAVIQLVAEVFLLPAVYVAVRGLFRWVRRRRRTA